VDALVVPGVGAAASAMTHLHEQGLVEPLCEWVAAGMPLLGICLGYQLLFESSDEGDATTLAILPGHVQALRDAPTLPHTGWNSVRRTRPSPLFDGIPDDSYFYFVHSYAPVPADPADILAVTEHGRPFASAVSKGSTYGVQFHPEKSAAVGIRLLRNFLGIVRDGLPPDGAPSPGEAD